MLLREVRGKGEDLKCEGRRAIELERLNKTSDENARVLNHSDVFFSVVEKSKEISGKLFTSKVANNSQLSLYERLMQSRMREQKSNRQATPDQQGASYVNAAEHEGEQKQQSEDED
eukprot:765978-Hanusia_phi.AAC.6